MKTKVALITVPLAIITFALSRVIWPDPVGTMLPEGILLPLFMFISAIESIAFGLGVSFAYFGWKKFKNQIKADKLTLAAYLAIIWSLVTWWPHDNMHRANGMEYHGLIRIEFLFHFTLIIAACIIAKYFLRQLKRGSSM